MEMTTTRHRHIDTVYAEYATMRNQDSGEPTIWADFISDLTARPHWAIVTVPEGEILDGEIVGTEGDDIRVRLDVNGSTLVVAYEDVEIAGVSYAADRPQLPFATAAA